MPPQRTRKLKLIQGPEGAPNFCFGLYNPDGGCIEFVDSDWNYVGLAQACGWSLRDYQKDPASPCNHNATDGTVPCGECGADTSEFLSAAYDFLAANDGKEFEVSGDYAREE